MSSLSTIRSSLYTKLVSLTGDGQPLVAVYDYINIQSPGYPYAVFEPESLISEYEDTVCNNRQYKFNLFVIQEITNIPREDVIDLLVNIFDEIMNLLDNDYTLGGVCTKVQAMGGEFIQENDTNAGAVLMLSIPIMCHTLYNTTGI